MRQCAIVQFVALGIGGTEVVAAPCIERDCHGAARNVDGVETLFLLADAGRGRGAGLNHQRTARPRDEVAGVLSRGVVHVARQQHIDSRLLDGVKRQFLPADCALNFIANLHREHRVMGDQHSHRLRRRPRESVANEFDLVFVHPAFLEGQRTRRIDAEHCHARELDEGTQALVDEPPIARQRRQEAPEHIVEGDVVIAGHAEHLVPALAQPFEEAARLLELLGARALGEVAADDDEVGLELVDLPFDGFDQPLVMGAEMEIGKVNEPGHSGPTPSSRERSAA